MDLQGIKENITEAVNTSEKINELQNRINVLEENVNKDNERLEEIKEQLMEEDKELTNKSVEELLDIEVLEGDKRAITIDGERIEFENKKTEFEMFPLDSTEEEAVAELKKLEVEEELYKDQPLENKIAMINILREQEALLNEFSSMQEEFNKAMEEFNDKYNQLTFNTTKENVVKMLEEKVELYDKYGKKEASNHTKQIIEEILLSLSLNNILGKLNKLPKEKIKNMYLTNYNNAFKKFYTRLKKNKKYKFVHVEKLEEVLYNNFTDIFESQDQAKLFLYVFYNYFHSEEIVNKYSIFINEVFKNISRPEILSEDEKELFKQSMIQITKFFN